MDIKTIDAVIDKIQDNRRMAAILEEPAAYDAALKELVTELKEMKQKSGMANPDNWPDVPTSTKKMARMIQAAGRDLVEQAFDIAGHWPGVIDLSIDVDVATQNEVPGISVWTKAMGKNMLEELG